MKVVIIRHGKTPGNLKRQYIGRTDQPLSDVGKEELHQIFESEKFQSKVDSKSVSKIYVSPMTRCKETAKILFPEAVQIAVDGIKEMDFGIFEEKSADELMETKEYKKWLSTRCEGDIPEGENKAGFSDRCCEAFVKVLDEVNEKVKGDAESETVYFLAHGGTIMSIFERFANEEKEYYQWYAENGHGYMADWKDGKLTNIEAI